MAAESCRFFAVTHATGARGLYTETMAEAMLRAAHREAGSQPPVQAVNRRSVSLPSWQSDAAAAATVSYAASSGGAVGVDDHSSYVPGALPRFAASTGDSESTGHAAGFPRCESCKFHCACLPSSTRSFVREQLVMLCNSRVKANQQADMLIFAAVPTQQVREHSGQRQGGHRRRWRWRHRRPGAGGLGVATLHARCSGTCCGPERDLRHDQLTS